MSRKVCTAGVVGSYSFMVLDASDTAVAMIRGEDREIVTRHTGVEQAEQWTQRKLRELTGREYEDN